MATGQPPAGAGQCDTEKGQKVIVQKEIALEEGMVAKGVGLV